MSAYYTDGHSVRKDGNIYCVATDVPAATDICNALNHRAEFLEALEAAETALIKDMEDPEGFNWEQSGLLPKIRAAIAKARQ